MSIKLLVVLGAVALLILSVLIYLVGVLLKKVWLLACFAYIRQTMKLIPI